MFEIKNATKRFGEEYALRSVSMNIGKGLNFIIGSSGSGKTTLLNILGAMEQEFEGDVFYCGESIKTLTETQKSDYYNNIFGFVWQDFNLLEDLTVLENVMLPQYLKPQQDKKAALRLLRELKISELADQKAGQLSGGQKQRVAIARELVKNPQVILADEPTSALDEASAKITMDILRSLSKSRTVIVVTHDTTLIDKNAKVYELDKGELVAAPELPAGKPESKKQKRAHRLSFGSACRLAKNSVKSKPGRTGATVLSLVVAAALLLVPVSGAITDSSAAAFQTLYETYGEGILDIDVVGSFTSAGGTNGAEKDQPNADVDQNIDGLYDRYLSDERVSHIVYTQSYNDIRVTVDGKEYTVATTGSVPIVNRLVAGTMPMGEENEVVIPESFLKELGLSAEQALGKTIDFAGSLYNWDSGEPVLMPARITAKIVGVADTTMKYDAGGEVMEYSVEDSFFFSRTAIKEMRQQAQMKNGEGNFSLRAKTPADMIAIKDELNAQGIVPLGRFELVEDMVRLNAKTAEQSGVAVFIIGALAIVAVLAVALMTALARKREYAIFKVSGYANRHLLLFCGAEALLLALGSAVAFLCLSPLIHLATTALWNVAILNGRLLLTGVLLVFCMGALYGAVAAGTSAATKAGVSLKTGGR